MSIQELTSGRRTLEPLTTHSVAVARTDHRPAAALRPGRWLAAAALALATTAAAQQARTPPGYPDTKMIEQIDDYHGTKVADPYRWLEAIDSADTKAWIEAENQVTEAWLSAVPSRKALVERLTQLFNYERRAPMGRWNKVLFFSRNTGLQKQSVVFMEPSGGKSVVVLDPNEFSQDGTVALSGFAPSEDARHVAYATSDGGSDWKIWHVRDLGTMKDLPDTLRWSKFSDVAWTHDHAGFFYCKYPTPKPGDELEAANYDQKVYYHKLGETQAQDALVYERPDQREWGFDPGVTDDGRWLVLGVSSGTDRRNRIYLKDLSKPDSAVVKLLDDFDASYDVIGNRGTTFYFRTDLDAPRSRIIAIDVEHPERAAWKAVVPMTDDQLQGARMLNGQLVLTYLHDASSRVQFVKLDGTPDRDLKLPGIGTAGGFGGRADDTDTYYSFTSFTAPATIYRYDFKSGTSEVWFRPNLAFDFSGYETKLVFAKSKDGTRVPIHVTHRAGLKLDGSHPCQLYGYGGFNLPLTPNFQTQRLVWLELGGVYAQAVLRGGSEYGEQWHAAGMLGQKQNVFDDFIGAAEFLIQERYTNPGRLAIHGGSNGGLLVGACLTQRPELFGAAVPAVGVLDMLRYHEFTIGWAWASEYGRADNAEHFPFLHKYSPLHNVKAGAKYPPTLILTGDHDDRVLPAHSFKFAAALQKAQGGDAPVLIRIETRAGHGAGKSTQMMIEEQADVFAFLTRALGMESAGARG